MLSRSEASALDAYLTRSDERDPDEDMYCPLCGLAADKCEEREEHEGEWWTHSERAFEEAKDLRSESKRDSEEER